MNYFMVKPKRFSYKGYIANGVWLLCSHFRPRGKGGFLIFEN